jgi:GAF domain-containing protein
MRISQQIDRHRPHGWTRPSPEEGAMVNDPRSDALATLAQFLITDAEVGDTLHQVAAIVLDAVAAASVAGVSMLGPDGVPTTGVYTDAASPAIDEAQYASGRGPCLEAWRARSVVRIDDVDRDGARYPEFADACRRYGIASTLSLPLAAAGEGVGALNLYAPSANGFTNDDEALGRDLAAAAGAVLANVTAYRGALELGEHLSQAMQTRAVIEQAKGMLMARDPELGAEGAFEMLRAASQREHVKLRDIAQRIVDRRPAG